MVLQSFGGLELNWFDGGLLLGGFLCAFYFLPWPEPLFASGFWFCTIIVAKSDLAFYLIPDAATLALAGLGFSRAVILNFSPGITAENIISGLWAPVASALLAFALFFGIGWIYERLTGREGLGFGDVKLAGALGLWLDPRGFALALELAALSGFLLVLRQRFRRGSLRSAKLPLGAFLAPAGFLVYFASCFAGFGLIDTRLS
jgi:prepilin signal peptidase PulO-like enzyme (type II secretory pathway)